MMQNSHRLLNTAFTSVGIACSLLIAMLCIEFMIVGNFDNILPYVFISIAVASVYFISITISQKIQARQKALAQYHSNNS